MMTTKRWWALGLVLVLASCGGGGGDAGSSNFPGTTPTTGDTTGGTTTPTTPTTTTAGPATSITFVSASPVDAALTVKGTGGVGRTETATLTFKVVDAADRVVEGASVAFAVNANSDATLSASTGTTNAAGQVAVQVRSGLLSRPVVVTAVVAGVTNVRTQSSSIQVSNGVAVQEGFELVADTYNLDGGLTGDEAELTIFVRDSAGNPVANGLSVGFTTDNGAVASALSGSCLTANNNGTCSVFFRVQDPRGSGIATVTARAQVGDTTVLTDTIQIFMASAVGYRASLDDLGLTTFTTVALSAASGCRTTQSLLVMDGNDHSPAAGTTISTAAPSATVSAGVLLGSPVNDQLAANSPPSPFTMSIASGIVTVGAVQSCQAGDFVLIFETPSGRTFQQRVTITSAP